MTETDLPDELAGAWRGFRYYLLHERRYVWPEEIDESISPRKWLGYLKDVATPFCLNEQDTIWRARLKKSGDGWEPTKDELGAPPIYLSKRGQRASAAGIRVFYGSGEEQTALAEVRPWVGCDVWTSQWKPVETLSICDLTAPSNPDDLETAQYRDWVSRLLAHPIEPGDEEFHYVLSQYMVEWIRNEGFDGIRYLSAQNPSGHNIVVFDPRKVDMTEVSPHCVTVKSVDYAHAAKPAPPIADIVQFKLNLPAGLLTRLKELGESEHVSSNSLIVRAIIEMLESSQVPEL